MKAVVFHDIGDIRLAPATERWLLARPWVVGATAYPLGESRSNKTGNL